MLRSHGDGIRFMRKHLRVISQTLKREIKFYQFVLNDARTPKLAKLLLWLAIGYFLLPFDLIPDCIPIIGHLDDVILVPLLIFLALRIIPRDILDEYHSFHCNNHQTK